MLLCERWSGALESCRVHEDGSVRRNHAAEVLLTARFTGKALAREHAARRARIPAQDGENPDPYVRLYIPAAG